MKKNKTLDELLDDYKEACRGNGWNDAIEQEEGPFHPGAYEDETTPRLAIVAEFDRIKKEAYDDGLHDAGTVLREG